MRIHKNKGVSLMETVIIIAIIAIVFFGMIGLLQTALKSSAEAQARLGAKTLAQEHLEYLRSLDYDLLGTQQGVPSGSIPQTQQITLNGVDYTKRTLILYVDDPKDGLETQDSDSNLADYKMVKSQFFWTTNNKEKNISFSTIFAPNQIVPIMGGNLLVHVLDSESKPVSMAQVRVTNTSLPEPIDMTVYTDIDGKIMLTALPESANYHITVSKPLYSTDQTHESTPDLPDPIKGPITITHAHKTVASFAIDLLSDLTLFSKRLAQSTYTEDFNTQDKIISSSNTQIRNSAIQLEEQGGQYASSGQASIKLNPDNVGTWQTIKAIGANKSGSKFVVKIADKNGQLVSDAIIPGNSTGISAGEELNLMFVNPNEYDELIANVYFTSNGSQTAQLDKLEIKYQSQEAFPNAFVRITGEKLLGYKDGKPVFKFDNFTQTDSQGKAELNDIEWDIYHITATSTSNKVSMICPMTPLAVPADSEVESSIYFAPLQSNVLLVFVRDTDTSAPVSGAQVSLAKGGGSWQGVTNYCGQVVFDSLANGRYDLQVDKSGYETFQAQLDIYTDEIYYLVDFNPI